MSALCTPDEVLAMLKLTDRAPDAEEVQRVCDAAGEAIETYTKRQFVGEEGDRFFTFAGFTPVTGGWEVVTGDFHELTGVIDEEDVGLVPTPVPRNLEPGHPWQGLFFTSLPSTSAIIVSAKWGWAAVPEDVHYAAIQQAAAWYTMDSARLSDSWSDEMGGGGGPRTVSPRSLLYGVKDTVRPYRFASLG